MSRMTYGELLALTVELYEDLLGAENALDQEYNSDGVRSKEAEYTPRLVAAGYAPCPLPEAPLLPSERHQDKHYGGQAPGRGIRRR